MSKKAKVVLMIGAYSVIAFLVMYFLIGFDVKKVGHHFGFSRFGHDPV